MCKRQGISPHAGACAFSGKKAAAQISAALARVLRCKCVACGKNMLPGNPSSKKQNKTRKQKRHGKCHISILLGGSVLLGDAQLQGNCPTLGKLPFPWSSWPTVRASPKTTEPPCLPTHASVVYTMLLLFVGFFFFCYWDFLVAYFAPPPPPVLQICSTGRILMYQACGSWCCKMVCSATNCRCLLIWIQPQSSD